MELSLLLAQQIVALFLIGVVGYAVVKIGMFEAEDSRVLSTLCVYVCSPCVVINSFQIACTPDKVKGLLIALAASIVVHIVFIGLMKLLQKPLGFNSIERASVIYSNSGNLIIPLVSATLGPEWVFYTSAYTMVQTVLVWTHGKALISRNGKTSLADIVKNPNIIAILAGGILFAAGIRLPGVLDSAVSSMGSMIGPVSMLVIGMLMGKVDILWVLKQKRVYFVCLFRLVVLPVICILLFRLTGVAGYHPQGETIILIVLLAGASSAAALVTQLAQVFGGDAKYASVINVMSVIFCVVTMPLMVLLYEVF